MGFDSRGLAHHHGDSLDYFLYMLKSLKDVVWLHGMLEA